MRLHRWLMALYPRSFRNEYGGEMDRVFRRRRRDASGPIGVAGLWMSEIVDVIANASRVHLDILRQDLRYSLRVLRRSPGFFAAAVIVTALGIAATTASFTLTDHVLVRPLPFPGADRLVKLWQADPERAAGQHGLQGTNDVSPANYRDWKNLTSSFESAGAYTFASANLVGAGDPERLAGALVTADAMRVIGVSPATGRALSDADDRAGAACAVLVSHDFAQRKFPSGAIGQNIVMDQEPCSIAGVMPRGFDFPVRDLAFWRPIRFASDSFDDRNDTYLRVIARLKPGVSEAEANADLTRVSARLAQQYPAFNRKIAAVAIALRDEINDQARLMIYVVAGASACLLLIACTNLASLFLARATSRHGELSIRTALGAGSERLVRQLLTDAVVIALAGGGLGVLIAIRVVPLIATLAPNTLPIGEAPAADWRMLLVAAMATVITVLTCGVLPALRAARHASAGGLRDGARTGASRRTERLHGVLVVAQVAASVALLICAGLLLRALWRVQAIDPGFKTGNVLTMRLSLPWPQYAPNAARTTFYRRVVDDIGALPGVEEAALASYLPLTMRGGVWEVFLPGRPAEPGSEVQMALTRFVTPRYFSAMSIPLVRGRVFDDRDTIRGEPTAIVSETFGNAIWPGESSIGRRFVMMQTEVTIVGIVGEVKVRGLERRNEPQVYLPSGQQPDGSFINYTPRDLAVKMRASDAAGMGAMAASIRGVVNRIDPQLPISSVRPLAEIVTDDTAVRAVQANVLRAFAVVAIVLAGVGLHGLLAFMVSARTRELGIRLALGAAPRDILSLVIGRGLMLACIGGAIGLGIGYLAGMSFRAVLAGVNPADIVAIGGALGVSIVMVIAGSVWPAIRAARINPIIATRAE